MSHPTKSLIFLALSFADLVLTWLLLGQSTGEVYESNPIANWWLARYGWSGLIGFKASAVLLVMGLGLVISWHRPRLGGRVLEFGCFAVAAVVLYSMGLVGQQFLAAEGESPRLAEEQMPGELLCRPSVDFDKLRERLSYDLVAHRRTLEDAARALAETNTGRNPIFQNSMARLYPDLTFTASLAANLVKFTIATAPGDATDVRRLAEALLSEFHASYATTPPWSVEDLVALRSPDFLDSPGFPLRAGTPKRRLVRIPTWSPIEGPPSLPGGRLPPAELRQELSPPYFSGLLPLPSSRALTELTPSPSRGRTSAGPGWNWRWPL
jgi:hypothetical protein